MPLFSLTEHPTPNKLEATQKSAALRVIIQRPRWTKVCNPCSRSARPRNNLRRQCWPGLRCVESNSHYGNSRKPLSKGEDFPHPNSATATAWKPSSNHHSHSTVLSAQQATLAPRCLTLGKSYRSWNGLEDPAPPLSSQTDGSVDPATGAAGAAFVSGQTTKQWRLTDGASCLQAELVAIRGALHHALESHSPHVIIHTDSKSSIQALRDTQTQDNIHLLTSTLLLAQRLAARGCKITLNWVPRHVGLSGNEAADRAAKSAVALPSPTTAVLPSLSQTLLQIKSASHALSRQQHEATVALSSPSASWYAAATAYHPLPQDPSIPPHVRDRLHRLRLGFPCFEEILQGAVDITCDHCQVTSPFALQHYLLKCEATSNPKERLPPHPQPGHPGAAAAAAAVIRSVPLTTLTSTVREYPPSKRLAARGCKSTLNWVPSHVGLSGNEAADRAAKSAAALPSPTTAVLPSFSQTLLKIKSASHALSRQQHETTVALSSPSASWYAAATAYHPPSQDPSIPLHVRDRLQRLRLGFPCFQEIRQGAVDITCDHCQVASPFALQHYLLK
ncbi:hypothetical protein GWK47_015910 [Chionoecetes opilio]|uniref:ribonuclease H n=1 Tax=Chionoecetes opilio TaxID=41210 RepID=A0A8J4XUT8_CHIOP|nr:hypothetical protein GWK47_015910 [Chionoecetes opilio]